MELSLLTREQLKYLVNEFITSSKPVIDGIVAATPTRFDDLIWAAASRFVLTEDNINAIVDRLADRLGIA